MNTMIYPERYKNIEGVNNIRSGWDSVVKAIRDDYQGNPLLTKAKAAIDAGLNDSAINYFWNLTMHDLYRKILAYGIDYFKSAINWSGAPLKTISDLREVKDYQIISGAYSLGIIPAESHFFLQQCREIRNNFSTAHYPMGEIDTIETANFIKNCIKYVLTLDLPAPGMQIKDLIDQMGTEKLKDCSKVILSIENQAPSIREAILHNLFSNFIRQDCDPNLKYNIKQVAPNVWELVKDDVRSNVAARYTSLKDVKNEDAAKEAEEFLKMVDGIKYIPEDNRAIIFNRNAQEFLDTHFGWDNFYNEPTYAKNLLLLGSEVPQISMKLYVLSVLMSFIGNSYGISDSAQQYNVQMLLNLPQSGVNMVFHLLENELDLIWTLTFKKPAERINPLMEILREKTIHADYTIIFKFYIGSDAASIRKYFDKKYHERTDRTFETPQNMHI